MSRDGAYVIGVDLGGTNMQSVVVDARGEIIGHEHRQTDPGRGIDAVLNDLADIVRESAQEASLQFSRDICAIGIAAPGAIEMASGIVLDAPNLGWKDVPLRSAMIDRTRVPVIVENDVNAAAWGEFTLGAARQYGNMMAVWVGTGVGGGIILDGQLFHGAVHSGGEIGQTVVSPGGMILERHSGRIGMTRLVRMWGHEHPDSLLHRWVATSEQVPTKAIFEAISLDDALAKRIVADAALHLGTAVANCVTLLGIEAVVFGGGVTESLGESLLQPTREAFKAAVFPDAAHDTALLMTSLTSNAGTLGAAMLAREQATIPVAERGDV